MKKKWMIVSVLAVFFLIGFISPTFAQNPYDTTHKLGLGLRYNYFNPEGDKYLDHDADFKGEDMFGASLSYGVSRWLSLQLAFDSSLNTYIKDETLDIKVANVNVYPLTCSAQLRYMTQYPEFYRWMALYTTFGFGYYFVGEDTSKEYQAYHAPNKMKVDIDGAWGGHIGAGFDIFATKNVALNFEFRYFWANADITEVITTPIKEFKETGSIDLDSWMVGVGIKFYFGLR